jgi:hypothetical protein
LRRLLVVLLAAGLQVAAVNAPFVHAHPDHHDTDHHYGPVVHTHWTDHAAAHSDSPILSSQEPDRAVFLNLFVAVPMPSLAVPAIAHAVFLIVVPRERHAQVTVLTTHSHDPPHSDSLSPRAPPFLLS